MPSARSPGIGGECWSNQPIAPRRAGCTGVRGREQCFDRRWSFAAGRAGWRPRGIGQREECAMAKQPKPNSTRKPPVPSNNHASIEEWSQRLMPDLQPIVQQLDELIRETFPGLHYAVKWQKAYNGLPQLGWIIELVAYDVSVNIVFFGGADFDSPPPLGSTARNRYIKIKTLEETQSPEMRTWIEQVGRVLGWA